MKGDAEMRKFMVIVETVGNAWTQFFDNYAEALLYARSAECGIGALWQMYQWDKQDECYKLFQT